MTLDDIISVAEAAEQLGIAGATLRAQAVAGRIDARNVGTTWITTRQEVERYRRENLGRRGRPYNPHVFHAVKWMGGAYGIPSLVLQEKGDIGDGNRAAIVEVANKAIDEGARYLADVTSRIQTDPRLRALRMGTAEFPPTIEFALQAD